MGVPEVLNRTPFPQAKWGPNDKPVLILDGQVVPIREIDSSVRGDAAYVVGVNQASFEQLCTNLRATAVHFYEMRVSDLSPLKHIGDLNHLAIRWNTKLSDLSPLGALTSLESLILEDTPKAHNLSPLQNCSRLQHIEFSGGIWNKNTATNLAPLASLKELRTLTLMNLKIVSGGLRPIVGCKMLQSLTLSNQFATEDYAYLSVALPETKCELFAPYISIPRPIEDNDVMVVGRRKPFLNSSTDKNRLAKYAAQFAELQSQFASDLGDTSLQRHERGAAECAFSNGASTAAAPVDKK
jgi:hypothetical protein